MIRGVSFFGSIYNDPFCVHIDKVIRLNATFNEQTTPEQFLQYYARNKPALNDSIIVTCQTSRRSEIGAQQLILLGYTK